MPTMPRLSSARVFVACRRLACLPPSALHSCASSPARFVRCCVYVRAFVRQCMFVRARSFAALSCPEKLHGPNHVYEELNGYRCNVQRMTCNMQHTACNIQRATCNVQHATRVRSEGLLVSQAHSALHATPIVDTCAAHRAADTREDLRSHSGTMQHDTCEMQHSLLQRTRCNARCCNAHEATVRCVQPLL